MDWQKIEAFSFGPAEAQDLRGSFNYFPCDTNQVLSNIASGSYDLSLGEIYTKGLPALDYLLHGLGSDATSILSAFTDPTNGPARLNYLEAIVLDMKPRMDAVHSAWMGSYRTEFVQNTGKAAGTSLSLIINGLNQHFEWIKRDKLGLPSGVLTLMIPNPDKVEAYYGGYSKALAVEALQASKDLFEGRTPAGFDGLGLDDYLAAAGAVKSGVALEALIESVYQSGIDELSALVDPLSQTIETDAAPVVDAYNEIVKNLVNLKTDMPSVLCVAITYIDNPSDSD